MNRWIANTIGVLVVLILGIGGAVAAWRTWREPSAVDIARKNLDDAREREQAEGQAQGEQQLQDLKNGCQKLNDRSKDEPLVVFAEGTPAVQDWRWGKPPADWNERSVHAADSSGYTTFTGYHAVDFQACWSPTMLKWFKGDFECSVGGASNIVVECKAAGTAPTTTSPRRATATTYLPGFRTREAYEQWRETHCTETRWELDCGE